MEKLSGEWIVVDGHGSNYVSTARAITTAVAKLRIIADDELTIALSFGELRGAAKKVAGQIEQATSRYEVTGTALIEYAEELRAAQAAADAAIESYDAAHSAVQDAAAERDRLEGLPDAETPSVSNARDSLIGDQGDIISSQVNARQDAEADWEAAKQRKNDAAEEAIAKIRSEIEDSDLNDSFWDNVWGGISDFFEAIGDAIVTALKWIATVVVVLVIIVAAVILALALIASGGWFLLLLGGLLLFLVVTWVASGGAAAFVKNFMRTGDPYAAFIAGTIAWAQGTFPGLVDSLVDGDAGSPVRRWSGTGESVIGEKGTPGYYLARLQGGNIGVDAQSGGLEGDDLTDSNSSMITVTLVDGPNGRFYRVNIPSTQQWSTGSSSINDIHSDAAAKLDLDGQTQLEQAVRDAMQNANVPPGSNVLLSGWSLGGITAGNLAADSSFTSEYNVKGVIVAGASVDDQDIPRHIPVLTFSHSEDPVPKTENPAADWHGDDSNRTNVTVPTPPGHSFPGHAGGAYQETMTDQGNTEGSGASEFVNRNGLEDFFVGTETPNSSIYQRGN